MIGRVIVACKGSGRSLLRTAQPSSGFRVHALQVPFSRFTYSTTPIDVAPSSQSSVSSSSLLSKSQSTEKKDSTSTPPSLSTTSIETKPKPTTPARRPSSTVSNRFLKGLRFRLKIPEPLIFLELTGFRRIVIPQAVMVREKLAQKAEGGSINPAEFIDEMNKLETKRILKIPEDLSDCVKNKPKFGKFIRLPSFAPRSFRKLISAAKSAVTLYLVTGDRFKLAKAKRELMFLEEHYMLYFPDIAVHTNTLDKAFSTFAKKKADRKHLKELMNNGGVEAMLIYRENLDRKGKKPPVTKVDVPMSIKEFTPKRKLRALIESIPTQRETVSDQSEVLFEKVKEGVKNVAGKVQESVSEAVESVPDLASSSPTKIFKTMMGASSKEDAPTLIKEQSRSKETKQPRSDP